MSPTAQPHPSLTAIAATLMGGQVKSSRGAPDHNFLGVFFGCLTGYEFVWTDQVNSSTVYSMVIVGRTMLHAHSPYGWGYSCKIFKLCIHCSLQAYSIVFTAQPRSIQRSNDRTLTSLPSTHFRHLEFLFAASS